MWKAIYVFAILVLFSSFAYAADVTWDTAGECNTSAGGTYSDQSIQIACSGDFNMTGGSWTFTNITFEKNNSVVDGEWVVFSNANLTIINSTFNNTHGDNIGYLNVYGTAHIINSRELESQIWIPSAYGPTGIVNLTIGNSSYFRAGPEDAGSTFYCNGKPYDTYSIYRTDISGAGPWTAYYNNCTIGGYGNFGGSTYLRGFDIEGLGASGAYRSVGSIGYTYGFYGYSNNIREFEMTSADGAHFFDGWFIMQSVFTDTDGIIDINYPITIKNSSDGNLTGANVSILNAAGNPTRGSYLTDTNGFAWVWSSWGNQIRGTQTVRIIYKGKTYAEDTINIEVDTYNRFYFFYLLGVE